MHSVCSQADQCGPNMDCVGPPGNQTCGCGVDYVSAGNGFCGELDVVGSQGSL